jgi:16S rRNA C967 or C1407 C5-methylase (RsmB/RsmF family)/NOL1/NOP2/fmu family ribosome biogenesis protein
MESLPQPFREQIQRQVRDQYDPFIEALRDSPPTSIRYNPKKNTNPLLSNPVPWTKWGTYLSERPSFTLDPTFHAGSYYVQEASSMFLEHALSKSTDLNQSMTVLDLCAAPGGKSTHLLSLLNDRSFLVSNEVVRPRASILSENIQKWGYPNCLVTNNDPQDFTSLNGFFDVIVIDAPCSGEGMFRKDPQAIKEWSPENVNLCAARQQRILDDVYPALKENGLLIYCTCTYNEKENEDNLIKFQENHSVEFIDLTPNPAWNIETIKKGPAIGYRFFPHKTKGEGFFLSAMRKSGYEGTIRSKGKTKLAPASKKASSALEQWIVGPEIFNFFQHNDLIFLLPAQRVAEIEILLQHLKFVYGGTNVATTKHEKLIPEHALAVSTLLNRTNFPKVEVDDATAIKYLRRDAILVDESVAKGFTLLVNHEHPIGWANVLQNRVNNMYPQEWRIRMSAV